MSQRDVSNWLPSLLGPVDLQANGEAWPSRRKIWNFIGDIEVEDVPNDEEPALSYTRITIGGGGGGGGTTVGPTISNAGTGLLTNVTSTSGDALAGAIRFTGVAPQVDTIDAGADQRRLVVWALGGPLVLKNEGSGTAAKRILTGIGKDILISQGHAALLAYDPTSSRWRVVSHDVADLPCCNVADYGIFANGISDDRPGFERAATASVLAGHYRVCVPEGNYFFGTTFKAERFSALFVNNPIQFVGRAGARTGPGRVKITVAEGLTGFAAFSGVAAEGGAGADGWSISGIEIVGTPTATVKPYAPETHYDVGDLIKPNALIQLGVADTGGNKHLYEVIRGGDTTSDLEVVAIAAEPHTPDRCTSRANSTSYTKGAIVRAADPAHWDKFFIKQNSGTQTSAASEPTMNYTIGGTTTDGGVTWECLANPNILIMGTVICRVVAFDGIISMARVHVSDCRISDFQNACCMVEGNASTPIIDADARGSTIQFTDFRPPFAGGGTMGLGLYFRGGELKGCLVFGCRFDSRVATGQGSVALPTDGTQHQHGLLDNSTFGQMVVACTFNGGFTGFDYWASGSSSEAVVSASHSDLGRCRFDASSTFRDFQGAKIWGVLGMNQFNSTATGSNKNGLVGAKEVSPNGQMVAALLGGDTGPTFATRILTDSGDMGEYYSGGWLYKAWATGALAAWGMSNRQVAPHANAPRGREPGEAILPLGVDLGPSTDSHGLFSNLDEYRGIGSRNRRGGWRRAGDIVLRPDRTGEGAYAADRVITDGYEGPTWTANSVKSQEVAIGSSSSHLGSIVAPTDTSNKRRFLGIAVTGDAWTGASEPAGFASATTIGVTTVTDNHVTWLYVGDAPETVPMWGTGTGGSEWIRYDDDPAQTEDDETITLFELDISEYEDGAYTIDHEFRGVCDLDTDGMAAVIYKDRLSFCVKDGEIVTQQDIPTTLEASNIRDEISTAEVEVTVETTTVNIYVTGVDGFNINWEGKYKISSTRSEGSAATGVTPVAPDDLFGANLKRWYLENYTAATGVWVDETGTFNTTQSGAGRRPSASTINGHACASFDGSDDGLVAGTGTAPFTTACTIFGVLQTSSLVGTAYLWCKTYAANAYGIGATLGASHKLQAWINHPSSPAPAESAAAVDDGVPHTFVMTWDGTTVKIWIDDELQVITQAKASPLNTTSDLMSLGSAIFTSDGTHDYHYTGKLGNTGLADRLATDGEVHSLSAYLAVWAGT